MYSSRKKWQVCCLEVSKDICHLRHHIPLPQSLRFHLDCRTYFWLDIFHNYSPIAKLKWPFIDSIMFFMTFWRTFRQSLSLNSRFKGMTLVNLMFRDGMCSKNDTQITTSESWHSWIGIIYFGVISIVNLVTVLMFLVSRGLSIFLALHISLYFRSQRYGRNLFAHVMIAIVS